MRKSHDNYDNSHFTIDEGEIRRRDSYYVFGPSKLYPLYVFLEHSIHYVDRYTLEMSFREISRLHFRFDLISYFDVFT